MLISESFPTLTELLSVTVPVLVALDPTTISLLMAAALMLLIVMGPAL